jgi:hypothetical protein
MGELRPRSLIDRRRFTAGAGALAAAGLWGVGPGRGRAWAKPEHDEILSRQIFWARPDGPKGELIGYGLVEGQALFTLPAGQIAADGNRYLAAVPAPESGDTWLKVFDPWSGQLLYGWHFDGAWTLGGISASGRFAALTGVPTDEQKATWTESGTWQTEILVVDLDENPWPHRFVLDGNFEVEVLSARGDALFLVEHRPAARPDHYVIRLYDLLLDALQEGELVDKRNVDEVMAGLAWDSVASADGTWLLTLYLSTARDVAFVHTLNLVNRYPVCIDLPSGFGEFDLLKHYTQALAPNGRSLFAANPALGAVAVIDLGQVQVTEVAGFDPTPPDLARSRSAVSADGAAFYFTGGQDVWVYDAAADEVRGALPVAGPIIGLGVSPDDRHVLVARPDEPLLALDPTSGAAASFPLASR